MLHYNSRALDQNLTLLPEHPNIVMILYDINAQHPISYPYWWNKDYTRLNTSE